MATNLPAIVRSDDPDRYRSDPRWFPAPNGWSRRRAGGPRIELRLVPGPRAPGFRPLPRRRVVEASRAVLQDRIHQRPRSKGHPPAALEEPDHASGHTHSVNWIGRSGTYGGRTQPRGPRSRRGHRLQLGDSYMSAVPSSDRKGTLHQRGHLPLRAAHDVGYGLPCPFDWSLRAALHGHYPGP